MNTIRYLLLVESTPRRVCIVPGARFTMVSSQHPRRKEKENPHDRIERESPDRQGRT
jgi:hypothetical protein